MNLKSIKYLSIFLLLVAFAFMDVRAEGGDKKNNTLNKITGSPVYKKFNINRISTFFKNDGESDINPNGNSGFEYPRRSGKTAIFQAGFLWGGKVGGQIRVGGSVYRQGTVPGKILNSGVPAEQLIGENPNLDNVRCYRVRPDYLTGSVQAEIDDGEGSEADVRAAYERDWMGWPAADGAPFEDVDGNGVYDPAVDVPGVPGADQTIWFVCNDTDPNQTQFMYGSLPMGIEEQVTVWGYNSAGPLGSMLFRKYKIINKSNAPITDMYVSMWNDADLGDAADDFSGCDTTLSLTYVYNANPVDQIYGSKPAAAGFDFFQGPIVPGLPIDTAIFNGQYVVGMKNLPMTAHYFYINPDAVYRDPTQGQYQGTLEWYNFMKGRVGTTGDIFPDPTRPGETTVFALYGDPVAGTGWVDGLQHPPGDRRAGMASGPFTMAAGDTQEVVVAEIAAIGANSLNSITLLKAYDKVAQDAYDKFFVLPAAPRPPVVVGTGLDQKIVLNWGSDLTRVAETESHDKEGFTFQGYNVYQLPDPSATKENSVRIATFDIVDGVKSVIDKVVDPISGDEVTAVQQYGSDNGIERSFLITKNYINNTTLNNGSRYYFAVTSYAIYNHSGEPDSVQVPNNLENTFIVVTVVPQNPDPGVRYSNAYGDTVQGVIHEGPSDGAVVPIVIDPTKLNGNSYKVTFDVVEGEIVWDLTNTTKNVVIATQQTNQSGDQSYPIIDGLLVKVEGPALIGVDWSYTGERWLSGNPDNHGDLMFGSVFVGPNFWGETTVTPGDLKDLFVEVFNIQSYVDANSNGKYDVGELYTAYPDSGQVVNLYRTWGAGNWKSTQILPMKFWDVTSDPPRQLSVIVRDRDQNGQWDPDDGNIQYNYIFVLDDDYDPTGNNWNPTQGGRDFMAEILVDGGPVLWSCWWVPRGTREQFSAPFTMTFIAPKVNTSADVFTFTAPSKITDSELAKQDVNKINVFPNPYYGVNPQEINKYERFVTINHLPDLATIRIFNLAGQLVRTIEKTTPGQFQRWDLTTDSGLPVASGLYIIYVDMPDLGRTKILKAAVIQEQQILDRY